MQLTYASHYKTSISAILDVGETLGNLGSPDMITYNFIKVDGHDPNYLALLEQDPLLETVIDPLQPILGTSAPGAAARENIESDAGDARRDHRRDTRSDSRKSK